MTAHRWRLDISYDGTEFAGWAIQPGQRTVQGELERWITQVLRVDAPVQLVCAGRTDAGVHARGQVAHVDLDPEAITDDGAILIRRLARVLSDDVVVRSVSRAPDGFDARFAAIWRRYVYRLSDAGTLPDPLLRGHITPLRHRVDLDQMNEAGAGLLGLRDFGAFCRRRGGVGATTVRTLLELSGVRRQAGSLAGVIEFTVRADAFCHSMVRSLMGALVAVGSGRRDRRWLDALMQQAQRVSTLEVMPARGLTLEEVRYAPDDQLHQRAREARATREISRV